MLPDSEILAITCEVLDSLGIGEYTIKVRGPALANAPVCSHVLLP